MNILPRSVRLIILVPTRMSFFLMDVFELNAECFFKCRFGKEEGTVCKSRRIKSKAIAWQNGNSRNKGRERSQYFTLGKASVYFIFAPIAATGAVSCEEYHHRLPCWQ